MRRPTLPYLTSSSAMESPLPCPAVIWQIVPIMRNLHGLFYIVDDYANPVYAYLTSRTRNEKARAFFLEDATGIKNEHRILHDADQRVVM